MKKELNLFKALSNKTRYKIIKFLLGGEKCVCEIYPFVKRTQSTTSIQLSNLKKYGLVKSKREGKKMFYRITDIRISNIFRILNIKR